MKPLKPAEKQRYQSHLILDQIGEEGQEKICQSSVLVVGAGGLGCPVMQYLTAAGVGRLGIVDDDRVDITNLQRQVFYGFGDIGKHKSIVAAAKMERMNGFVAIDLINSRLNTQNALRIVSEYDIIVDCTDNIYSRYLINDACVICEKPMVYGGVFKVEGQISVFNYRDGPTYRCLYPEPDVIHDDSRPVGVYSVIPGIIGTLQVNEVLKIISGSGQVLSGMMLTYHAMENRFFVNRFSTNDQNKNKPYIQTITKLETK